MKKIKKPTVACNPDYIFLGESNKERIKIKRIGTGRFQCKIPNLSNKPKEDK